MSHHAGALLIETFSVGILALYNLLCWLSLSWVEHLPVSMVLMSTFTVQGLWLGIPQITRPWKHILMENLLDTCMFPNIEFGNFMSWSDMWTHDTLWLILLASTLCISVFKAYTYVTCRILTVTEGFKADLHSSVSWMKGTSAKL